jgi:hypothetical protein
MERESESPSSFQDVHSTVLDALIKKLRIINMDRSLQKRLYLNLPIFSIRIILKDSLSLVVNP